MKLVADLHIHSHYSRATSKNLTIPHLAVWAQRKGVHIVGTGDIAHPGWLQELKETLEPAEEGLFRLKEDIARDVARDVPPACQGTVRFMLAGEISTIYKKNGRVRKIHHVVFAPSFNAVEKLQARLERIGNIRADGRPILGLDSRDLLEILLEIDERCYLIPAHIWTPWFALLGSKSGFDSVEECFDDLTPYIFALETGLSSDPPMNWRVSALDRYTLVSNSDAHSPQKLAREANVLDTDLSYDAIFDAIKMGDPARFLGTIEFFPEEGKYHYDGHRKCGVVWEPKTTIANGGRCPVCGKPVTVGVMHRVEELADRPEGQPKPNALPYYSLIPLPEVLGELLGVGAGSKRVQKEYEHLLARLGPEIAILMDIPLEEIAAVAGPRLAEGIGRMRRGEVTVIPGFDGQYGIIRVFEEEGRGSITPAVGTLFDIEELQVKGSRLKVEEASPLSPAPSPLSQPVGRGERGVPSTPSDAADTRGVRGEGLSQPSTFNLQPLTLTLNPAQREAVTTVDRPLIIVAGPGTGKTLTLTARIAYLIAEHRVPPEQVLAITFTNKAAEEMAERLEKMLGADVAARITVQTFHAFGAALLRAYGDRLGLPRDFVILGDEERRMVLRRAVPELGAREVDAALEAISQVRVTGYRLKVKGESDDEPVLLETSPSPSDTPLTFNLQPSTFNLQPLTFTYLRALRAANAVDYDDLILLPLQLFEEHPDVLAQVQARYRWISVDEYQDVNAAQYRLLRLLTAGGANLCVIGDPDQAIYGFRGADRSYFLRFQEDYPNAKVVRLTQNYRSVQAILDAATQVISKSPGREAVRLFSEFVQDVKLEIHPAPTDRAEAEYVVHQIEQIVGGTSYFSIDSGRVEGVETPTRSFGDIAVLYRLRALVRPLIEAFDRSGIPYQTVGETPLTAHRIVREALAYLWLVVNPESRVHREIILDAWGLPPDAWDHLAATHAAAVLDLLEEVRDASVGAQHAVPLLQRVRDFLVKARDLREDEVERLDTLVRVGAMQSAGATHASPLRAFLERVALHSETDLYDPRADRVALMTLHAAKGLEFPVVFIVGCEEGILPYLPEGKRVDVEEERRLFYVGMTRAKEKLVLTHARRRFLYGRRMDNRPSRFIDDIEEALKEIRRTRGRRRQHKEPEGEQLSLGLDI